jgi:hypothetical protein
MWPDMVVKGMSTLVLGAATCFLRYFSGCLGQIARRFAFFRWSARLPGRSIILALVVAVSSPNFAKARVLNEKDFEKMSEIKTIFTKLTSDISQSLKRPDISSAESDCIKSTLRELVQTSEELSSYQYLIAIVSDIDDFGDDDALRGMVRFALDKSIGMLETERKRLSQVSDQCIRFPLSVGTTQQAMQFMDVIAETLKSIRPRI